MDGKLRLVVAATLLSMIGTGCSTSLWKGRDAKTVKVPEKPLPKPLVLKDEQNIDIQFALARTFEKDQEFDQAAEMYRRILEQDAEHFGATHRLAIVYDQQGHYEESEPLFRKALQLKPGNADLFCDVGYSLYRQQRWEEAERNYRQAVAISPTHRRAHNHLGLVLAVAGRETEALKEFHKSGCSLVEARMNLALIHSFEGRPEQAKRNYELAQQASPGSKEIAQRLREIESVIARTDSSVPPSEVALARRDLSRRESPTVLERAEQPISTVGFESQPAESVDADDNDTIVSGDRWWNRFKVGFRKRSAE